MTDAFLTAVIAGTATSVVGPFVVWLLARRRNDVDTAAKIAEMWEALNAEQKRQINDLALRVTGLELELNESRHQNQRLREENTRQRRALRSFVQWAKLLQSELKRLGGSSPPIPDSVIEALAAELP